MLYSFHEISTAFDRKDHEIAMWSGPLFTLLFIPFTTAVSSGNQALNDREKHK